MAEEKQEGGGKPKTLVGHLMNRRLVSIDSNSNAFEIANRMIERHVSAVVIADSGRPVGILTERDLARQVCAKDLLASKTPGTAVMSAPLVAVGEQSTIEAAAELMIKNRVRHLAVEDKAGRLTGMITATDLARYIGEKLEGGKKIVPQSVLEALYSAEEPAEEGDWSR